MTSKRSYLLVPMMPTPNGALHLGHAAGPYLKMDILARYLRQLGHDVRLITTTDCFENHVLQSAERMNLSLQDVCAHFHEAIRLDFEYLKIEFDEFLNPMHGAHVSDYQEVHARATSRLIAAGAAHLVEEQFLVDEITGKPILGFRLTGRCAGCEAETVGLVCENCGLQMTTEMLGEPRAVMGQRAVWRKGKTLALRIAQPAAVARTIDRMDLPEAVTQPMRKFLDSRNLIRLTTLDPHGVGTYKLDGQEYTLYNTYFGHALFCGEVYRGLDTSTRNPFVDGSGVITVTSCGLDNVTDITASIAFANAYREHHSFDHFLPNFFLTLRGRKFSTGAKHAIFVASLSRRGMVQVDALRMYLADISPHDQMRDFEVSDFVRFHNEWFAEQLISRINKVAGALSAEAVYGPTPALQAMMDRIFASREVALSVGLFSLSNYVRAIKEYTASPPIDPRDSHAWLKGFAMLAWALIPGMCEQVWTALGYAGTPMLPASFQRMHPRTVPFELPLVKTITASDLT